MFVGFDSLNGGSNFVGVCFFFWVGYNDGVGIVFIVFIFGCFVI